MLGPMLDCGDVEGERLRLVPTMERHLDACVRWLNDPAITRYLGGQFAMNDADEKEWYARASSDRGAVYWSIEVGDTHVGQTGIEDLNWIARTGVTGIVIGEPEFWRKGIATAVMRRRAAYAFDDLNLVALFTQIFLPNEPSRRAAVKAGYREYGRRPYARYQEGEYLEEWLGVLTRDDWKAAAPNP